MQPVLIWAVPAIPYLGGKAPDIVAVAIHTDLYFSMKCLENLLTSNALRDTLCLESYKRGGLNAGILHEVQKEG